jgi:heme A synthase
MKNLFKLNLFFIGVPSILMAIGIANDKYLFYGLLFSILTGLFQVVVGLKMASNYRNDNGPKIYLLGVVLYFTLWFIFSSINYKYYSHYILFIMPAILALYLSVLIYKKINDENY